MCGELRGLLGFKVRHVGLLVRDSGECQILGRYTLGQRGRQDWKVLEDVVPEQS